MAKVTYISIIKSAKKRMGDVVFAEWRGISYVRRYIVPPNPNSPGQRACRGAFSDLVKIWKELPEEHRQAWRNKARGKPMTGYNLFIRANINRRRLGQEIGECP